MRVLVTGGNGFIGRRLIARLHETSGHDVTAVVRDAARASLACRTIALREPSVGQLHDVVMQQKPDAIVHLAAAGVDPRDRDVGRLTDINAVWPAALVRAAAEATIPSVIIAGSSAEYAAPLDDRSIPEDAALEYRKLYGATKAAGCLLALASGSALGVDVAVLRLFNVYGEGEAPHRLLPSIVSAARAGRQILLSAGTQVRDFVDVDDACGAIEAAVLGLRSGRLESGPYNVCSGTGTTVAAFATAVVDALGADRGLLQFGAVPLRPDDLARLVGDPKKFSNATGWSARELRLGIAQAVGRLRRDPTAIAELGAMGNG